MILRVLFGSFLVLPLLILSGCGPSFQDQYNDNLVDEIRTIKGEMKGISERVAALEPPTPELAVDRDAADADEYLHSEQSCQDCLDWYIESRKAQNEFKTCERHWYFSTHMATVCTFTMPWKAPSGRTVGVICPGFNNKFCPGPMWVPSNL